MLSSLEALRRHEESHSCLADWQESDNEAVEALDPSGVCDDNRRVSADEMDAAPPRKRGRIGDVVEKKVKSVGSEFPCPEKGCGRKFAQVSV